jgi:hypothetical protein
MNPRRQVALGLISACCCLVAVNVGAQAPSMAAPGDTAASHARAAERLLSMSGTEKAVQAQTEQSLQSEIKANPAIASQLSAMHAIAQKYVSYAAIKPDLIKAYTAIYTENELDQIIAFYQTDLGKMMLDRAPKVLALTTAASMARVQAARPEMEEAVRKLMSEQAH